MKSMKDRGLGWPAGKKGGVFPAEDRHSTMRSAEGAGHLSDYPDTEEAVLRDQEGAVRKVLARAQPRDARN